MRLFKNKIPQEVIDNHTEMAEQINSKIALMLKVGIVAGISAAAMSVAHVDQAYTSTAGFTSVGLFASGALALSNVHRPVYEGIKELIDRSGEYLKERAEKRAIQLEEIKNRPKPEPKVKPVKPPKPPKPEKIKVEKVIIEKPKKVEIERVEPTVPRLMKNTEIECYADKLLEMYEKKQKYLRDAAEKSHSNVNKPFTI